LPDILCPLWSCIVHMKHFCTKKGTRNFVRYQVLVMASIKCRVFWVMAPCSHDEVDRRFRGTYCLHHQGDEGITLMMEAVCTSETSVHLNMAMWHNIPENCTTRNFILDLLRPSGNYEPSALTVSNAAFCIYWFCMVLNVNSDYFRKQR
jgi:hypothetical protein